MNFLSPWFLAGALLVIGPIVVHLIRRSTRDRTQFSATRFLTESQPELQRKSRVQHPLLLLLRCIIVGLIATAFARPFFANEPKSSTQTAASEDVVVLLDESASMRRKGVWPEARERLLRIAGGLQASDRLTIIAASHHATSLLSAELWSQTNPSDREALLRRVLQGRQPGWGPLHLDAAIDTALQAFADNAPRSRKRLVIVSDFASATRIAGLAGRDWPSGLAVFQERVATPITNNASVHWLGWTEGEAKPLLRLRVSRDRGALSLPLRVKIVDASDDQPVGESIQVELASGESRVLTVPLAQVPMSPLRVSLSGDTQDFDNQAYIVPPSRRELRVLYLGEHDDTDPQHAAFYVGRALAAERTARISYAATRPDSAASAAPAALYIVDAELTRDTAESLRRQLEAGAYAVLLLSTNNRLATASALANETEWALGNSTRGDALFGQIDFTHALFAPFADPRFSDFTHIRIWQPLRFTLPSGTQTRVIARFDDDSPAVTISEIGRGRLITFASDWSPRAAQWVLSSKFVPWLHALLEQAAGGPTKPLSVSVATPEQLTNSIGSAQWRPYSPRGEIPFTGQVPTEPGVYELNDSAGSRRVALQVPPEESRTDALPLDALEQLGVPLKPVHAQIQQHPSSAETTAAAETESRQKLWRWLLIATAALLAVESGLALVLGRKSAATASA
jgi:hypothetical protein